jgi:hypothetical protein
MTFIFLGRVACESCEFVTTSLAFTLKANPDAKPPPVANSFRRVIFILFALPFDEKHGCRDHFRGSKSRYHTEKEGTTTTCNNPKIDRLATLNFNKARTHAFAISQRFDSRPRGVLKR